MTLVDLKLETDPARNANCQCENVLRELAEHGIRFLSLAVVFDHHGVGRTLAAEYRPYERMPFVRFRVASDETLRRLEETLVSLATAGLRSSLEPRGLEVRNLSAVMRVCTVTGGIYVAAISRCSPLPELGDEGYCIVLRDQDGVI